MGFIRAKKTDLIGRMDKKFTIYAMSDESDDGWGNTVESVFHTGYAEVIDTKARDYQFAVSAGTIDQLKLRIRYKKGITNDMTVELNGERHSIVTKLNEDSRKPFMFLVVERKTL